MNPFAFLAGLTTAALAGYAIAVTFTAVGAMLRGVGL